MGYSTSGSLPMKPNLEYDLFNSYNIVQKCKYSILYSQNLYASMCNNNFYYGEEEWNTSWHGSGSIVADLRDVGEDYLDWYCSGMEEKNGYVPESFVTDEIRLDLIKLGWTIKSYKPKLNPGVYTNVW
jgi:hypothetical protein